MRFAVSGMQCAACSARVQKTVEKLPGVTSCAVNLLTGSLVVEGTCKPETIIKAVKTAGYGCKPFKENAADSRADSEKTSKTLVRLVITFLCLLLMLYIAPGYRKWGWPLPAFVGTNPLIPAWIEAILSSFVLVINRGFFVRGCKALFHRSPSMDTLISIGAGIGYLWSLYTLLSLSFWQEGSVDALWSRMTFHTPAMILSFVSFGKWLEEKAKQRTTDALTSLTALTQTKALVVIDGEEREMDVSAVQTDMIFSVKPGGSFPVDGVVVSGESDVNESMLTGESRPIEKEKGSPVYAGTINGTGALLCRATSVGQETKLAKIIQRVSDAMASKAPIERLADRIAAWFVPAVCLISAITFGVWFILDQNIDIALTRAVSVLVVSCPCSLGLATPVAVVVGTGVGAKHGILFKSAGVLEKAGKIDCAVFDKTGTLTKGTPAVGACFVRDQALFEVAASLESFSEHPISKEIIRYARGKGIENARNVQGFSAIPGKGLSGTIEGEEIFGGRMSFIADIAPQDQELLENAHQWEHEGKTVVGFASKTRWFGCLALEDTLRDDAYMLVEQLKKMKIQPVILSGDQELAVSRVANHLGVEKYYGGVSPEDKQSVIEKLSREMQCVAMIGDGINDAPALASAQVSVSLSEGTDVARDASDVILASGKIDTFLSMVLLSRCVMKTIKQNLFWALFYNCVGIPLAAGLFGWGLPPMFAAVAMSLSSLIVVMNALRVKKHTLSGCYVLIRQ